MACPLDVTYLDEWKNFLGHGITKAGVGMTVVTQTTDDCCAFAGTPTAIPEITTALGADVTVIGGITSSCYKTRPVPPRDCEVVDCCVFTMSYIVSWGLNTPWGFWKFGSQSGTIQVWVTSDGRSGKISR